MILTSYHLFIQCIFECLLYAEQLIGSLKYNDDEKRTNYCPHRKIYMLQSAREESNERSFAKYILKGPLLGGDIHAGNLAPKKGAGK